MGSTFVIIPVHSGSLSKICSHTVAAAEDSGRLGNFLRWYVNTQPCPNISKLAMQGMPSNCQIGNASERKRLTMKKQMSLSLILHYKPLQHPKPRQELVATTGKPIKLPVIYLLHCICGHLIHLHPVAVLQWILE